MKIKKAIFPVAGYGTRFLPATKAQPKEMLPIVDKPIIQYHVEECVKAGIEDIIFVTGRGKASIENHFDHSFELDVKLNEKGKIDLAKEINKISDLANFAYIRQSVQNGDGGAILQAQPYIDPNEAVLIVYPDYIMHHENDTIARLLESYDAFQAPVITADRVPMDKVSKYGVMSITETQNDDIVKINTFVEKPKMEDAPSDLIATGSYIITPEVFRYLNLAESTHSDGEIRLADAFYKMAQDGQNLYGLLPQAKGYDCGSKIGFLKATVDYALEHDDLSAEFQQFLQETLVAMKR